MLRGGGSAEFTGPVSEIGVVAATDGEMARLPELELFAARHGLPMLAIDDLTAYVKKEASGGAILATARVS